MMIGASRLSVRHVSGGSSQANCSSRVCFPVSCLSEAWPAGSRAAVPSLPRACMRRATCACTRRAIQHTARQDSHCRHVRVGLTAKACQRGHKSEPRQGANASNVKKHSRCAACPDVAHHLRVNGSKASGHAAGARGQTGRGLSNLTLARAGHNNEEMAPLDAKKPSSALSPSSTGASCHRTAAP